MLEINLIHIAIGSLGAVVGAVVASYLNTVVYRLEIAPQLTGRRSVCDNCERRLNGIDLIPVFGYIWRRGKCPQCKAKVDIKYVWGELIGAAGGALAALWLYRALVSFAHVSNALIILTVVVTILMLSYLGIYDLWTFSLPTREVSYLLVLLIGANTLSLAAYLIAKDNHWVTNLGTTSNLIAAVGYAGFFWIMMTATKKQGLGIGDVYIAAAVGLVLGIQNTVASFYATVSLGAVFVVLIFLIKKRLHGIKVPFIPFLYLGFMISLVYGPSLWQLLFPHF
jgi:prepilin signal peptidase PulO-like enzyme (type II secretory pathway)